MSSKAASFQERKPGEKPVLIRADETDPEAEKAKVFSPELAKENVKIGDFYFKRDNYKAAEARYREAIEYNPQWPEAYEKLVEALEKLEDWDKAIEACELFQQNNPEHKKTEDFQEWIRKLEERKSAG